MTATVREGGPGDVPELMASMREAFDPRFGEAWTAAQCSGVLGLPGVKLLLARDGADEADAPAGFALFRVCAGEAELLLLGVRPRRRGAGIGAGLLQAAMAVAGRAGAASMFLEMRDGNPAAALYARAGFVEVGRRPRYYRGGDGTPYDALTLSGPLTG